MIDQHGNQIVRENGNDSASVGCPVGRVQNAGHIPKLGILDPDQKEIVADSHLRYWSVKCRRIDRAEGIGGEVEKIEAPCAGQKQLLRACGHGNGCSIVRNLPSVGNGLVLHHFTESSIGHSETATIDLEQFSDHLRAMVAVLKLALILEVALVA